MNAYNMVFIRKQTNSPLTLRTKLMGYTFYFHYSGQ